CLQFKTYPLTF
nr:immunoglobulin light chain junction region [Macaca mulatta]